MEKQNTFAHLLYLAAVTHMNNAALFLESCVPVRP